VTDIGPSLRRADYGYDVESDFLSEMLEFDVVVDGLLQTLPLVPVDGILGFAENSVAACLHFNENDYVTICCDDVQVSAPCKILYISIQMIT